MNVHQQNSNGIWTPADPIPPTRSLRVENWLRRHGMRCLASGLARWDERGLGR